MTIAWELISSERKGQVGRRAVVAKTYRMPDGTEAVLTVTGDGTNRAVACVALTPRQTVVLAEQYRPGDGAVIEWQQPTSEVLSWLLVGRAGGPVFLAGRRTRTRLSYRRAAELCTTLTRPLDPAGHGWTLHQLSAARAASLTAAAASRS